MAVKIDRSKLTKEEVERLEELEALETPKEPEPEPEPEPVPEAVQKMLDEQREEIRKANERADRLENEARIEKEKREVIEFTKTAHETLPTLPGKDEEKGALLMAMSKALPKEQYDGVLALLKAGEEAMKQVEGAEVGTDDRSTSGTAYEKIEALAKELVKEGKAKTLAQGVDQVVQTHPDLAAEHAKETRRVVAS